MNKVVFHINESSKWDHLIANVKNLIKGLNEVNIIVVANGKAVVEYFNIQIIETITDLIKNEVQFVACHNSLVSNHLDENLLHHNIKIVPAGIVELVIKQQDGYSYIKV